MTILVSLCYIAPMLDIKKLEKLAADKLEAQKTAFAIQSIAQALSTLKAAQIHYDKQLQEIKDGSWFEGNDNFRTFQRLYSQK